MNNDSLPRRKSIRLKEFDYNSHGAYFITICTKDRAKILSQISVGTTIGRPPSLTLTPYGQIVEQAILNISTIYPSVNVDHYVIMPNHVHLIIFIEDYNGRAMLVPTMSRVVQQMKGYVTKRISQSVWQSRFYDHVIRSERDYRDIWDYIENNPARWTEDRYYSVI
ncbi:MAG: transposase [Ruminococcus sp.]|nr:transposase [Ruminococcus sp.]MBQ9514489.1 transposase [Ruminococcus sp.]